MRVRRGAPVKPHPPRPPSRRALCCVGPREEVPDELAEQALAPLDKRHESYPWDVQWPINEADKVSEATRNDLARVSSIVATTEEAVNLQQRPLHPDMVVKEVVEW